MTHYMKLQPVPFEKISSGQKTIELRLFDEKRQRIRPGDTIIFSNIADSAATVSVTVLNLLCFRNFKELFASLPLDKCGYAEAEVHSASVSDMNIYYSEEEQQRYGVVGIEIALIQKGEEVH